MNGSNSKTANEHVTLRSFHVTNVILESSNFSYCQCVFLGLSIHHALLMDLIDISGLPSYTLFSKLSRNGPIIEIRLRFKNVYFEFV